MNKEDKNHQGVVTESALRATTNYCRALTIAHTYAEIYTPDELKRLLIGRGVDLTHIDVNLLHYAARKQSIVNKNIFELTGEAPKHTPQPGRRIRTLADIREALAEVERKKVKLPGSISGIPTTNYARAYAIAFEFAKTHTVEELGAELYEKGVKLNDLDVEALHKACSDPEALLYSPDYPPHDVQELSPQDKEFVERIKELARQYDFKHVHSAGQPKVLTVSDVLFDPFLLKALKDSPMEKGSFSIIKGRPSLLSSMKTHLSFMSNAGQRDRLFNSPFLFGEPNDFEVDTMDVAATIRREKNKRLKNKRRRKARKALRK